MATNTTYDPFTQVLTLLMPDGTTPFNTTLDQFDYFHHQTIQLALNKGSDLGATLLTLLTLLLLTAPAKRRTPAFALNVAALTTNAVRGVLKAVYLDGRMMDVYAQLVGDTARLRPVDYAVSVGESVGTLVTLGLVMMTLLLQVRAVVLVGTAPSSSSSALRSWLAVVMQRRAVVLLVGCGVVAFVACGFQVALTVANVKAILAFSFQDGFLALQKDAQIVTMVSLSTFMAIFVAKLGVAMMQRRRLGQRQFGPMQVLFIMGCQTLIVPTLLALLVVVTDIPEMENWYLTATVLSLPLSSLWATTTSNGSPSQLQAYTSAFPMVGGTYGSQTHTKSVFSEKSVGGEVPGSITPMSPLSASRKRRDDDLELGVHGV